MNMEEGFTALLSNRDIMGLILAKLSERERFLHFASASRVCRALAFSSPLTSLDLFLEVPLLSPLCPRLL